MTSNAVDGEFAPLRLYLAFEFLPVRQVSELLWSVGNAYDVGLRVFATPSSRRRRESFGPSWLHEPSLHIESVSTGQSIEWGFGPPKTLVPGFEFVGEDLRIIVPRWTAAAIFAGSILVGGAAAVNTFYELADNLNEPGISEQALPLVRHPDDRDVRAMDQVYGEFWRAVDVPNISAVRINGREVFPDATRFSSRR